MSLLFEGFSLNITSQVQETIYCSICSRVLQNPHQAPCGCRFCFNCIRSFLDNKEKSCPGQTEYCLEIKLNFERDLQQDALANREVDKLIVKCPFYLCDIECEFRMMKNHLKTCGSSKVFCIKCNENITRSDQRSHEVNKCKEGMVLCEFCSKKMKRRELEEEHQNYEHVLLCTQYTDYCPNECEEDKKVVWVKHRSKCKMKYLECPYKKIGCTSNSLILKNMELHLANKGFYHADVLLKHMENLSNGNSQLNHNLGMVSNDMLKIKKKYEQQENEIEKRKKEIRILKDSFEELKIDNMNLRKIICDNTTTKELLKDNVQVNNEIKNFLKNVTNEEGLQINFNKDEEYLIERPIFQEKDFKRPLKKHYARLTWNIENFSNIQNRTSSYFYTHERGYKMDLRLEKKSKGCLSLYVRLHPGEYDDELSWPLRKRVTIKLMDQEFLNRHYERFIFFDEEAGSVCDRKYLSTTGNFGFSKFNSCDDLREKPFPLKGNCDGRYLSTSGSLGISTFISYDELREKPYLLKRNRISFYCFVDNLKSK